MGPRMLGNLGSNLISGTTPRPGPNERLPMLLDSCMSDNDEKIPDEKTPTETPDALRQTPPPRRTRSGSYTAATRIGDAQTVELSSPIPYVIHLPDGTVISYNAGQPITIRSHRPIVIVPTRK